MLVIIMGCNESRYMAEVVSDGTLLRWSVMEDRDCCARM